jgi:hypothetical protein
MMMMMIDPYLRSSDWEQNSEEAGRYANIDEENIQIRISVKFQSRLLYRRLGADWIPMVS